VEIKVVKDWDFIELIKATTEDAIYEEFQEATILLEVYRIVSI
jgi:hypothetical protein